MTFDRPVRSTLICLALGVAVLVPVLAYFAWVSNDLRWTFGLGAAGLFAASSWAGRRRWLGVLGPVVVCVPPFTFAALALLPQIPGLWPFLFVLWALAALLGGLVFRSRLALLALWFPPVALLLAASVWYATSQLPRVAASSFERVRNDPAPALVLQRLDGTPFDPATLRGNVVVLDFFATWCGPCRAEMPELQQLRKELAARSDVEILIVADGSEPLETIAAFARGPGAGLPFAYDPQGKTHGAFGFTGLPALVVLDKQGRIRLSREGFNRAETGFRQRLRERLTAL